MALGFLFAWVGVNVAGQAGVYGLGVALFLIGAGQFVAWVGLPERAAYSLTGLAPSFTGHCPPERLGVWPNWARTLETFSSVACSW